MYDYLLTSRSLTYAQRTQRVLERSGFKASIIRTPQDIAREGCGYAVKVRQCQLLAVIDVLNKAGLPPKRVFYFNNSTVGEEVVL